MKQIKEIKIAGSKLECPQKVKCLHKTTHYNANTNIKKQIYPETEKNRTLYE